MKTDFLGSTCDNTELLFEQHHLMKAIIKKKNREKVDNVTCEGHSVTITCISSHIKHPNYSLSCDVLCIRSYAEDVNLITDKVFQDIFLKENTLAYEYFC